jgi:hypothetical protein
MNATPVVVHLHDSGMPMAAVTLSVIACLALSLWRFVFIGLRRRPLVRAIARRHEPQNNVLEPGLQNLLRAGRAIIADDRSENSLGRADHIDPKNRAKTYLHRIVELTGATQSGNGYVLDVGKARFHVRYRRVSRIKDLTDPKSAHEETCFYPMQEGMPKAEEIATALLQLKNKPALFDRWAAQSGAFKADGQPFSPAQ